jgi:hypothetical protein
LASAARLSEIEITTGSSDFNSGIQDPSITSSESISVLR